MVDPKNVTYVPPSAGPPINVHIHTTGLSTKDRARLVKAIEKEPAVTSPAKAAPAKPGYQTTEFWANVLVTVGALLAANQSSLPPRYAALAAALSNVAYMISRGLAKN